MKFIGFMAFLITTAWAGTSQGDIDYTALSQRFVTSVKEAQVESQFLQLDEVKACVKPFPKDASKTDIQKAQQDSANCMRTKLNSIGEDELTALSKKLELDAFGVVKGKSNAALVDYLSSRLEKALYGSEGGEVKKFKDQNLVDQKVFVDIYETQLGKNILLEISNYCYGRLNVIGADTKRLSEIASIKDKKDLDDRIMQKATTGNFSDTVELNKMSLEDDSKAYEKILGDIKSVGGQGADQATVANNLKNLFVQCATIIPKMCEYYEDCLCQYKNRKPDEYKDAPACNQQSEYKCSSVPGAPPTIGQHSCHVAARLRGYRTNLDLTKKTQKKFDEDYVGSDSRTTFRYRDAQGNSKEVYDRDNAGKGESMDDLTSFTTNEADKAFNSKALATEADEMPDDCAKAPERAECAKFFYKEDEGTKFEKSAAGYTAATLVESERIKKLAAKDNEKLKEYLDGRGYHDLAEKVGKPNMKNDEIVEAARSRFEAEREATFNEMTAAFERKQLSKDDPTNNEIKVKEAKAEYKNKGKEFQQLILFNNIVSSYLEIKKVNAKGEQSDGGKNSKAFEREINASKGSNDSPEAFKYFSELSEANKSSGTLENSDKPLVDIKFLDTILGKQEPPPGTPQ